MRFAFVLAIAAVLAPAVVAAQEAAPTVTVRGRVIDRASGQPLRGVTVDFPDLRARLFTDGDGYFAVERLPAGEQPIKLYHIGYQTLEQKLALTPGEHSFVMRMTADPVELAGVTVSVNRMEQRRIHAPMMSRVWGDSALAMFRRPSTRAFLATEAGVQTTTCGTRDVGEGACAWVRGEPTRVTVIVDEQLALGGLDDLIGLAPQDLYRVEVYRGGGLVVAYTKNFVKALARNRSPLHPFNAFDRQAEAMGLQSLVGEKVTLTP
ncbi:MAG TPA: carboxypeptidase-like regulatory domain-containing protein [Longimicrobiaceae bacterium]|nr:carboxypeptidase-like regulatory domain-containing protein [Longimicrobiaceae bacterium]